MITDSQVGLQRPTGFRRAEHTSASGVVGLVTNHYVAKIVSLLFAAVLVALIDRELETTLLDTEFDVRVGSVPQVDAVAAGRRQLILETESGVAVRFVEPRRVHMTVKGPQKLADPVKKILVGTVSIRAEWLKDIGGTKHSTNRTIVGSDVSIGVRGVEITLEPSIQVDLDPEAVRDVPLKAAPKDVAPGLVAEVAFEPAQVRLLGPASAVAVIDQITIAIPASGRTAEFTWQVSSLPDEVLNKHIRMAPDQSVVARVRFSKGIHDTLDVKDLPIKFTGSPDNEYKFLIIGLPKNAVTATLSGTPEAVREWNDRVDDLRKMVRAEINTDKLASKVSLPGSSASDYLDVEVVRIPDNLKLVSVTPAQVEVSVSKK